MTEQILDFIFTSSPLGISFPRDRAAVMKSTEKLLHSNQLSPTLRHRCRLPITAAVLGFSLSLVSHHYHAPKARSWFMATMRRSLSAGLTVNLVLSHFVSRVSVSAYLFHLRSVRTDPLSTKWRLERTICARQQSLKVGLLFSGVGERIYGSSARQNQRSQLINHRQFLSFLQINSLRIVSSLVVSLPKMKFYISRSHSRESTYT